MKAKSSPREVFRNTVTVLKQKNNLALFLAVTAAFALLYLFLYGVYEIPFLELGIIKMTPFSLVDGIYIVLASVMTGLIITLFKYNRSRGGKGLFGGGVLGAGFGIFCPSCLGTNLLIFGSIISLPVAGITPWLWLIQVLSLLALGAGFWFSAGAVSCSTCFVTPLRAFVRRPGLDLKFSGIHKALLTVFIILALGLLAFQISTVQGIGTAPAASGGTDIDAIISQVLPDDGFTLKAKWGGVVTKMVDDGIIDPQKLESILKNRYGQDMKPEWRAILDGQDGNLKIDAENSVFMMYMLWLLAKHDSNPILLNSPFASAFGPNYDIGAGRPGYGDTKLLTLTPEQQARAEKVAANSYRPCCGQSTSRPDCSHGYSALGLVDLMASQGFSEKEMFDAVVKVNSFWFPSTYIQNALYFKVTEGKDWNDVDKELVAGQQFSSLSGSRKVRKALQGAGY